MNSLEAARAHCVDLVRTEDRLRYSARLFIAEKYRTDVLILDAFRLETRKIPFLVKEPIAGEIRFQWWQEVLQGDRAEEAKANPISTALLGVVKRHEMPVPAFMRYFEALSFELYNDPMGDMGTFEGWLGETDSLLYQMAALICDGARASKASANASGHSGVATGISRLLGLLAYHRLRDQVFLPSDLLAKHDLTADQWLRQADRSRQTKVVQSLVQLGMDHALLAEKAVDELDKGFRAVFLPLAEAKLILKQYEKKPVDALSSASHLSPFQVHLAYWRRAFFGW